MRMVPWKWNCLYLEMADSVVAAGPHGRQVAVPVLLLGRWRRRRVWVRGRWGLKPWWRVHGDLGKFHQIFNILGGEKFKQLKGQLAEFKTSC